MSGAERNDPLLCFCHCNADTSIICKAMSDTCPVCCADLNESPLNIPPFRLPSPFVHSFDAPRCVLVKTTSGTFLNSYSSRCNLHVGVSDSNGVVYHFNERGINRTEEGWDHCLAVHILSASDAGIASVWNTKLQESASHAKWMASNYDESGFNCYDFVLTFLKTVGLEENLPCLASRVCFCDEMVVPQTKLAARYISLYRRVEVYGHVVQYFEESTSL